MPGSTSITLASWRAPCPCWETSGRARLRRQQRVVTSSLPGSSILRTTLPSTTLVSRWPITTLLGYGRNSASQTCAVDAGRHHCRVARLIGADGAQVGQRRALPRLRFDEAYGQRRRSPPVPVPNANLLRVNDPFADMSAARLS